MERQTSTHQEICYQNNSKNTDYTSIGLGRTDKITSKHIKKQFTSSNNTNRVRSIINNWSHRKQIILWWESRQLWFPEQSVLSSCSETTSFSSSGFPAVWNPAPVTPEQWKFTTSAKIKIENQSKSKGNKSILKKNAEIPCNVKRAKRQMVILYTLVREILYATESAVEMVKARKIPWLNMRELTKKMRNKVYFQMV